MRLVRRPVCAGSSTIGFIDSCSTFIDRQLPISLRALRRCYTWVLSVGVWARWTAPRERRDDVVAEEEELEVGEGSDRRREGLELVVHQAQLVQIEELSNVIGQPHELIIVQIHLL
jgi:hypothetical protein